MTSGDNGDDNDSNEEYEDENAPYKYIKEGFVIDNDEDNESGW